MFPRRKKIHTFSLRFLQGKKIVFKKYSPWDFYKENLF